MQKRDNFWNRYGWDWGWKEEKKFKEYADRDQIDVLCFLYSFHCLGAYSKLLMYQEIDCFCVFSALVLITTWTDFYMFVRMNTCVYFLEILKYIYFLRCLSRFVLWNFVTLHHILYKYWLFDNRRFVHVMLMNEYSWYLTIA